MALTEAYIAAAKDANIKPVTLISIESVEGAEEDYTTQLDWAGSSALVNISTTEAVGSAYPLTTGTTGASITKTTINGDEIQLRYSFIPETFAHFMEQLSHGTLTFNTNNGGLVPLGADSADVAIRIRTGGHTGTIVYDGALISKTFTSSHVSGTEEQGDLVYKWTMPSAINSTVQFELTANQTIYIQIRVKFFYIQFDIQAPYPSTRSFEGLPKNSANCNCTTSTIDMGVTPVNPVDLSIDDTRESGASIVYTAEGNTVDTWPGTSLGTVADGDSLLAYRYYRIKAEISSTNGGRGIIHGFNLREGIYRYYGSHRGLPFAGVQSVLPAKAVASVSQKIDPKKGIASIGQVSFNLLATAETEDMLSTGYLAGKDVRVLSGFETLNSIDDFRPIMVGTWQDYEIDDKKGIISVKLQDMLNQFQKRQLPIETYNAAGAKTSADIVYSNANVVAVMRNIFDRIGIRGRYLHPDYDALETGALSSADYNVTRTISGAQDADEMLDELAQTAGLFLVPLGDGRLTPKLQDPSAPTTLTLDVRNYKSGKVAGNQKELLTQFIARYNATVADPSDDGDYAAGYLYANNVAESLYDPKKGVKVWLDKWEVGSNAGANLAAPPQALIDWCDRQSSWFSEPRFSFALSEIPPYIDVEAGDVIGIDGLRLPIPLAVYDASETYAIGVKLIYSGRFYRSKIDANNGNQPDISPTQWRDENLLSSGLTDNKPFLVTSFKFDPNDAMSSIELREQVEE